MLVYQRVTSLVFPTSTSWSWPLQIVSFHDDGCFVVIPNMEKDGWNPINNGTNNQLQEFFHPQYGFLRLMPLMPSLRNLQTEVLDSPFCNLRQLASELAQSVASSVLAAKIPMVWMIFPVEKSKFLDDCWATSHFWRPAFHNHITYMVPLVPLVPWMVVDPLFTQKSNLLAVFQHIKDEWRWSCEAQPAQPIRRVS